MIREKELELRYALTWLGVGIAIVVLDCFPQAITWLAVKAGVANPYQYVIFSGFLFFVSNYFCVDNSCIQNVKSSEKISARGCIV